MRIDDTDQRGGHGREPAYADAQVVRKRRPGRGWRPRPPAGALVAGAPVGRRAAAVVALGFVAMLASSPGQSYWLAMFVDDMLAGTGLDRTAFSTVYALATVCSALMVLLVGVLFDRRGPAVTWLTVAGGLALGGLLMSVAAGAAVAVVGLALLRAFGQGSFPLVGTLLVARTFDGWRGRALAVAHLGSSLGAAVLPPLAAVLIAAFGWRTGLQVTAAVVLCVIAPLALLVRWAAGSMERARPRRGPPRVPGLGRALNGMRARARRFPWRDGGGILLVALSAAPLVTTAAVFHATSLLGASGLGLGEAAAALSVHAISAAGGAIVAGTVIDRLGIRPGLIAMNALPAAGVALLLAASPLSAYAGFALLGAASGFNGTGSGAAWAHLYGVRRLGELQGIGDAARIGAAALGPLPLAIAHSLTGGYAAGLIGLGVLAVACGATGLRLRAPTTAASQPSSP